MRKMFGLVAVALACGSVAGAQSMEREEGTYTVQSCTVVKDGVKCDITITGKKDGNEYYSANEFSAVDMSGTVYKGISIEHAGKSYKPEDFYNRAIVEYYAGVPARISVLFAAPATTNQFSAIGYDRTAIRNVPVRNSSAPAPRATTAAPVTNVAAGGYNVNLTGCTPRSGGSYSCTGATVTPQR